MKNLVFFLSFIVLTVVAWNKDESPANPVINTSSNTICLNPGGSLVELRAKLAIVIAGDKNKVEVNLRQKAPSRFNLINPAAIAAIGISRIHFNLNNDCMDDTGMGLSSTIDAATDGNREITRLVASADEGRYPY